MNKTPLRTPPPKLHRFNPNTRKYFYRFWFSQPADLSSFPNTTKPAVSDTSGTAVSRSLTLDSAGSYRPAGYFWSFFESGALVPRSDGIANPNPESETGTICGNIGNAGGRRSGRTSNWSFPSMTGPRYIRTWSPRMPLDCFFCYPADETSFVD